jgi:hypothetical protein
VSDEARRRRVGASLEADAVAVVDALADRKVLVGTTQGRLTMVIPVADQRAIVKRRRLSVDI